MRRILCEPNPIEGGGPANPGEQTPPPAAVTVLTGTKTERELELEGAIEKERGEKKQREVKIAELEDQLSRLTAPAPESERSQFRSRLFKI